MHLLYQHILKTTDLEIEEFNAVLNYFTPASFKKGQQIFQPGDLIEFEYFVLEGCLKAFYLNEELKMHILQFAMPEWWTCDYKALYNHSNAEIYLDCIEDTKLLCLSNEAREKMCKAHPKMEYFLRIRSNKGYVALQQRILSLLNNNAKERYETMQKMYPLLFQKVPKTLIASYLGVSRETLSRLYKNELKKL